MTSDAPTLAHAWRGLLDDAALFPPGSAELRPALAAYGARAGAERDLVASFVVTDERIPELRRTPAEQTPAEQTPADESGSDPLPVSVVVTGGAGALAGAARLAGRGGVSLRALEIALRDVDDLPGNARRVVAAVDQARDSGVLAAEVPVFVEVPGTDGLPGLGAGWLGAADVVAERAEEAMRLKFRTGGVEAHAFPSATTLAGWIDAALDREVPFKCTAGLHHAVRHTDPRTGFEHHGFLNALVATVRAFDGAGAAEVAALLAERDAGTLLAGDGPDELARGRRWLTSIGSCSVAAPVADLRALGLWEER